MSTVWRPRIILITAVGLVLGALWWLTRQAPPPVEATLPLVEVTAPAVTTTSIGPVVVHVAGAVVAPGVHELPAGSRVIDAVRASGGLASDADAGAVNLAAELVDGSQVYVPRVGEVPPPSAAAAPRSVSRSATTLAGTSARRSGLTTNGLW